MWTREDAARTTTISDELSDGRDLSIRHGWEDQPSDCSRVLDDCEEASDPIDSLLLSLLSGDESMGDVFLSKQAGQGDGGGRGRDGGIVLLLGELHDDQSRPQPAQLDYRILSTAKTQED